jgi:hypothetical protein
MAKSPKYEQPIGTGIPYQAWSDNKPREGAVKKETLKGVDDLVIFKQTTNPGGA